MNVPPYATQIDADVAQCVVDCYTGASPIDNCALHCANHVLNVAMGNVVPDPGPTPVCKAATKADLDAGLASLQELAKKGKTTALPINWQAIIQLILTLLTSFFGGGNLPIPTPTGG